MNNKLTIKQYIESDNVKDRIREVLKSKASQFTVSLLSAVNSSPALAECEPQSVMNAAMTAASLDLPINQNLGFAYIIPYKKKEKTKVKHPTTGREIETWQEKSIAQFQMGYKGFIQLAQRSGTFEKINVVPVYEGDDDETVMKRLTAIITPKPPSDKVIGYAAYSLLLNGFNKTLYMTIEDLKAHGTKYSANFKKYNSGLWADDFDAMARKTVIKLLLSKYAPLTTEMQTAQLADQAEIKDDSSEYVDNKKVSADEISEEKERQRLLKYISEATTIEQLEYCKSSCVTEETAEAYSEKEKELLNGEGGHVS